MKKIAVIGSGVAGLGCTWSLCTSLQDAEIVLYEKGNYLGGHTNTVNIEGTNIPVDTGFIVYNEINYPNLVALLEHIDVKTIPSDMSFAFSLQQKGKALLEWGSDGLRSLFAQRSNLLSISFWRMLFEIMRFGREAPLVLHDDKYKGVTIGTYLKQKGYSPAFHDHYILPMTAAIWSTPTRGMLEFPVQTLVHFMHNHQMLQLTNRPRWRTVSQGSRQYVLKLIEIFESSKKVNVRLNTPVVSVKRHRNPTNNDIVEYITVTDSKGNTEKYDDVVFACHAPEALSMLNKDATAEEQSFLSVFKYSPNRAYLHSDESLMPHRRDTWSAWNYIHNRDVHHAKDNKSESLVLTYWMNRLQSWLPTRFPLFVTLNPDKEPSPLKTYKVIDYEHPIYVPECVNAQQKLRENQGASNTYYCGAYTAFGFHEDGLTSGLQVAEKLGAKCPWKIDTKRYDIAPIDQSQKLSKLFQLIVPAAILIIGVSVFWLS